MQTARVQRPCALALLLGLALFCTPSKAESDTDPSARKLLASTEAFGFGVCGGLLSGLPGASDNALLPCPTNYGCRRNSPNYWQCFPGATVVQPFVAPSSPPPPPPPSPPPMSPSPPSPSPPPATPLPSPVANHTTTGVNCTGCTVPIEGWRQCGGISNCAPDAVCEDSEWPHSCCVQGFTCTRAYEWYWQCLPSTGPLANSSLALNVSKTMSSTPVPASTASSKQAETSFYESVNAGKANA